MKFHALLFCFLWGTINLLAQTYQVKGKVLDKDTKAPLPFVNIIANKGYTGTATDIDGRFELRSQTPFTSLSLTYMGYEKKEVSLKPDQGFITIELKENTAELAEVTVLPGENPAHRIIKNAEKNRKLNNPENIDAFSYKTYSKFILSINTDSVDPSIDTVTMEMGDTSYQRIDSSNYRLTRLVERQHLFMMETVTQRDFLAPSRDNETVLANRTSGFKNPLFSLIATEIQSFSFYDDYIEITGNEYLNPITPGSTSRYFFILEDTSYTATGDTVYVISFRPQPNYGFQPLQGVLSINARDWAVQSVIAEPFENTGIQVEIEQLYQRYGDHTWFPIQLNARLKLNSISLNDAKPYGTLRTYLKDINLNPELRKKDISRADLTISDKAVDSLSAENMLNIFRIDSLNSRERETYRVVDSIGKAENLDRNLKILATIATGKIPIYFFDLELDKLVRFNVYEGFRLGAGGHTNSFLSEWFKIGGYFGYGTRDRLLKYGWDTEVSLHKHSNLALKGGYQFDIFETGGVDFLLKPRTGLLADNYRIVYITQFDETSRYHVGFTYDPLPKLHSEIRFQRENRLTNGNYFFSTTDGAETVWQNGFNYSEVIASFRFSPNEKFIEGPGFGKITFDVKYPIVYLQYTRGLDNLLESDFAYDKLDARLEYSYKTVRAGTFSMAVQGGMIFTDLPLSKLFVSTSNLTNYGGSIDRALNLADRNSFETMFFNEFFSDRYVEIFLRQDFKSLLFRRENFAPHIELVTRATWGSMNSPERHQGIDFDTLEKGYFESGIEINKLYNIAFAGLGLGFYHRYGAYARESFLDNSSIKLTSKFSF